jgi:predicted GIY-YIG superfamily endonuclease
MSEFYVVCQADEEIPFSFLCGRSTMPSKEDLRELLTAIESSLAVPDQEYEYYRNWLFCERWPEMAEQCGFRLNAEQAMKLDAKRNQEKVRKKPLPSAHVYVMRCSETKNLKVGVSQSPKSRLKSIQTSYPHKLEIILLSDKINNAAAVEQQLHSLLASFNLTGEWFTGNALTRLSEVWSSNKSLLGSGIAS